MHRRRGMAPNTSSSVRFTSPVTVLAAIDYSEVSALVLQRALDMIRHREGGELHVVHVDREDPQENGQQARRAKLMDWLDSHLHGEKELLAKIKVVCHELQGDPRTEIVQLASDVLADVVIAGTHKRAGAQRQLLGSVAHAVTRDCGCPVFLVRPYLHDHALLPPCRHCLDAQSHSQDESARCERHAEAHGRCHLRFNARALEPLNHRMVS